MFLNDIRVKNIEAVNGCTSIQVELLNKDSDEEYRILIKTKDLFKAINNKLCENYDEYQEEKGWRNLKDDVKITKKDLIN